jgi:hypothetical protein
MSFTRIEFPREVPKPTLPVCDWVYFATPSQEDWATTRAFVDEFRMIMRTVYDSRDNAIANVKNIQQGDRILLVYGGGRNKKPYRPMFSCTVVAPPRPVPRFDAFSYVDAAQHDRLQESGFTIDPHLNRFTGISIEVSQNLERVPYNVPKPNGINTIRRWSEVFGATNATPAKGDTAR